MTRTRRYAEGDRARLMRAAHGACRALGLDADARHDVQLAVTGKASMRDMSARDLARLLAHLNTLQGEARSGATGHPSSGRMKRRTGGAPDGTGGGHRGGAPDGTGGGHRGGAPDGTGGGHRGGQKGASAAHRDSHSGANPRPKAKRGDVRLIHALWGELGRRGALKRPGRAGLNAFIRARFGAHWAFVPIDVDALTDTGCITDVIRSLRAMLARAEAQADADAEVSP
ncbi:hypothetical protein [Ruegeria sp.]|uniref:hypothetical protein n=1 Tax=Ruegeria sp. TaxID=1879320 RepID=UPI003B008CEB